LEPRVAGFGGIYVIAPPVVSDYTQVVFWLVLGVLRG
jgi:hypothetical protein